MFMNNIYTNVGLRKFINSSFELNECLMLHKNFFEYRPSDLQA